MKHYNYINDIAFKADNTMDNITGLSNTISNADRLSEANFPVIPFPLSQMATRTAQKVKLMNRTMRNTSQHFRTTRKSKDSKFDVDLRDYTEAERANLREKQAISNILK